MNELKNDVTRRPNPMLYGSKSIEGTFGNQTCGSNIWWLFTKPLYFNLRNYPKNKSLLHKILLQNNDIIFHYLIYLSKYKLVESLASWHLTGQKSWNSILAFCKLAILGFMLALKKTNPIASNYNWTKQSQFQDKKTLPDYYS